MKDYPLQISNVETVRCEKMKLLPAGTPTVGVVRKSGRRTGWGVITADCDSQGELVEMATFLANRKTIIEALSLACIVAQAANPQNALVREQLRAAYFMASGQYAGPAPPQHVELDHWRRRNGMVPKWGHLTEAEVRSQVQVMDESDKRAPDRDESFDSILSRYVERLRADSEKWDDAEHRMMGPLLEELEAGYVLET